MIESIFTKIVKKEVEGYIIHEDKQFIALLDSAPWTKGHTLVIPKIQVEYLNELPPPIMARMLPFANEVMQILEKKLKCKNFNLMLNDGKIAGQIVPHVHLHIIPRYNKKEVAITHKELNDRLDKIHSIIKF